MSKAHTHSIQSCHHNKLSPVTACHLRPRSTSQSTPSQYTPPRPLIPLPFTPHSVCGLARAPLSLSRKMLLKSLRAAAHALLLLLTALKLPAGLFACSVQAQARLPLVPDCWRIRPLSTTKKQHPGGCIDQLSANDTTLSITPVCSGRGLSINPFGLSSGRRSQQLGTSAVFA